MNIDYSNRAFGHLQDILDNIAEALYPEDAIKWRIKIEDRVTLLADTPLMGCAVSHVGTPPRFRVIEGARTSTRPRHTPPCK